MLVLLGDDLSGPAPSLAGAAAVWAQGHTGGQLPALDAEAHTRLADLVRNLVVGDRLSGVHDVSTGGLAVALAELAVHSGVGTEVAVVPSPAHLFAEHPARVVVSVPAGDVTRICFAARRRLMCSLTSGSVLSSGLRARQDRARRPRRGHHAGLNRAEPVAATPGS